MSIPLILDVNKTSITGEFIGIDIVNKVSSKNVKVP